MFLSRQKLTWNYYLKIVILAVFNRINIRGIVRKKWLSNFKHYWKCIYCNINKYWIFKLYLNLRDELETFFVCHKNDFIKSIFFSVSENSLTFKKKWYNNCESKIFFCCQTYVSFVQIPSKIWHITIKLQNL